MREDRAVPFLHLHGAHWSNAVRITAPSYLLRASNDPVAELNDLERTIRDIPGSVAAGFISYELGSIFEPRATSRHRSDFPLFAFAAELIPGESVVLPISREYANQNIARSFDRETYCTAVERVKAFIEAGDVFQVNLAQRFSFPTRLSSTKIDEYLIAHAPAGYGALIELGDLKLISNSPELFFRVTPERKIIVRPIKGTRPIAPGMKEELIASPKDQAELAMIVDLERNDLGRICEIGSVKVIEPRTIETHPTVYHGVATIEGVLRDDVGFVDILRAMFPCGSVTGAPKIRAMQIIDQLEPMPRGPYCGAIGYIASDGSMEFSVAIRTIIMQNEIAHVSVGGGIVADSDPADEYEETLVKAKAMFAALGV